uniref:HMG box domain-containing protein n=1 Tax=Oreochromis niloticus TaxID=8128 RepID=A0A669CLV3_ORENI
GQDPSATTATVLPAPPPHSCAPKKHQTKQGKDQAYIKKPPNAFMLYLKEQRPKVKAELNISDSAAVNAAVGERWKSLSKKELKNMRIFLSGYPNWLSYKRFNRSVNLQGLNLCLLVISLLFTCCD